jgi:hypothetical protein
MVIRDAAIYIAVFFLPLTFIAMIWPATSRYAKRLVEFLIAVILAKFVIVAIIGLASAALTNSISAEGQVFERMIAGAALLVLAAWSPFALLRLIPMMEIAAASVVSQRSSMSGAAQSAGISTPATYMRQAMDRHSRASASPASPAAAGTTYSRGESSADRFWGRPPEPTHETRAESREARPSRSGATSGASSGTTYAPPRPSTSTERIPRREHPPSSPPRQTPPPQPPRDARPPDEEG